MTKQTVRSDEPTNYTVEQRASKLFTIDPGGAGSASIAVQSPDAVDRNLVLMAESVASGGVQSPDAADRNLAFSEPSGAEPHDVAPAWIGDGSEMPMHNAPVEGIPD